MGNPGSKELHGSEVIEMSKSPLCWTVVSVLMASTAPEQISPVAGREYQL